MPPHPRAARAHVRHRLSAVPLQVRLVAIMLVLMATALSVTTAATAVLLRRDLVNRVDDELRAAATPIINQVLSDLSSRGEARLPTAYALTLLSPDGQYLNAAYPTTTSAHPDVPPLTLQSPQVIKGQPFTVSSIDSAVKWRMVAGKFANEQGIFVIGLPLDGVDRTLSRVILLASLLGFAVMLVAGLSGSYLIRRAFRPLRVIEDTAGAIASGDLTRRIPDHPADDEVASLSRSLNAMLARIESSFTAVESSEERLRQFVADASHELRTPLVTVRGYAELYRQGAARDPESIGNSMARIESEAARMAGLVEDLLQLARMDQEADTHYGDVDLTVIAADATADTQVTAPTRKISLVALGSSTTPLVVRGADHQLRQVVANLLSNALRHTPADTPIEIAVGARGSFAVIEVRDHGPGLTPDQSARVFERFYRADPSRGRAAGGGNGLGLAIVAAIVERHSGRVGVAPTPGGGATFVVELPLVGVQTTPR